MNGFMFTSMGIILLTATAYFFALGVSSLGDVFPMHGGLCKAMNSAAYVFIEKEIKENNIQVSPIIVGMKCFPVFELNTLNDPITAIADMNIFHACEVD